MATFSQTLGSLHPLFASGLLAMEQIDQQLLDATNRRGLPELSNTLGLQEDQLKYVICLLLAYPLALIHRGLGNNPTLKHLFSGFWGFVFGFFCFGTGMIHSLITAIATYLIVCTVKGPWGPKLVFAFTLSHLSISHLIRQIEDYGGYTLDYTGPQMILILKLTSFAYNVYDGSRRDCPDEFKPRALAKVPSLVEFFGFVYFFGGFLAGPAIEMSEYLQFTDLSMFKKTNGRIPSTFLPTLRVFFFCILCFLMTSIKSKYTVFFISTSDFFALSYIERYLYVQISVSLHRFQYYFIWLLAEGACVLSGLGYIEKGDKIEWDRCSNVDIVGLETSQNFKSITDSWNKKTNHWLKYYIYLRLTPPNGKPTTLATFLTYLTSAFWHGFYPGYYLTFFTGAFMTTLARSLRQKIRPLFDGKTPHKLLYDIFSWIATFSTLNYICASFVLLDLKFAYDMYVSLYFVNHVIAVLIYIALTQVRAPRKPDGAAAKPKST